jgi:endonuclease/exonuclease/phosphatase family metal-dependent hydrolase
MDRRRYLTEHLRRFSTLDELRRSAFYADCGAEMASLLDTPEVVAGSGAAPRIAAFVRVVQWNLEKGIRLDEVLRQLKTDAVLRWADVLFLNEADHGMIRSGNRHIAQCLAQALGMNMAFGAACLELTKGVGAELALAGENREGLQGNAVLSRYPILSARIVRLPQCFEAFEFSEKRYGGRNCLWVRLRVGARTVWAGSAHLEVRNTPGCRAAQMQSLMAAVPGEAGEPCLLGGDLNTNTFRRGTRWRAISGTVRFLASPPSSMKERLLHPERTEPLFRVTDRAGFSRKGFNSSEATACAPLDNLEDARMLPALFQRRIQRRLAPYDGCLHMKLDWLLGKELQALRGGEVTDAETGVSSLNPGCVPTQRIGPDRISDHSPIFADLRLPG